MAVDVVMPQMGESIFEGTITKWLKKPGDKVERDEPLFEISTDKVDAEIPSPSAGVLKEIKIPEGQTVPIQTVVAVIDGASGAAASAPAPATAPTAAKAAPAPAAQVQAAALAKPSAPAASASAPAASAAPASGTGTERIHSSPLVRRMAKEHGIDLASLEGSGAAGRITKEDIEAVIAAQSAPTSAPATPATSAPAAARTAPPPPPATVAAPGAPAVHGSQFVPALQLGVPRERIYFGSYEVQPLSVMRQKIAEHMVASKHVSPHVYSVDEIDMSKIAALRAKSKDEFEKRYETKLTFMPFFVKAAVAGLRAYPTLNASLDGTNIVLHKEVNIGI
ncbi:MAG TPA: 2-oxo acid dehydrogenase subunit E2, partial [Terracidiphilus sp.]|nr:2-oxo acid dehydrogenase subunit E2 [Terracidiphilus sp.]